MGPCLLRKDQRLLLVVDGLDEWTNEDAGRIGSQLLQAFVETHKVAVVVTSRPYGFRRLATFSGQDWQSGELAPPSEEQRSALCRRWFVLKSRLDAANLDLDNEQQQSYAVQESERFRDELARSAELVQLGETPLLLVLLLYMKFQHAVLPRRRFDAYDRILDHLLRYHPAAKRAAAFVTDSTEPLSDSDIRFALAQLAFVLHSASDGSVYEAMDGWPATPDVTQFLTTRLYDEEARVQRTAARSLANVARGAGPVGDEIAAMAHRAPDPLVRAAAIEGLSIGWPEHGAIEPAIASARESASAELRLAAIAARVRRGVQDEQDDKDLIRIASREERWDIEYGWKDTIPEWLAQGWPGVADLKNVCLNSVTRWQRGEIDRDIALIVLLSAFPHDPEVVAFFANEIRTEKYPLSSMSRMNCWDLLARNFRDEPELISAIESWAPHQEHAGVEISFAALVGRATAEAVCSNRSM